MLANSAARADQILDFTYTFLHGQGSIVQVISGELSGTLGTGANSNLFEVSRVLSVVDGKGNSYTYDAANTQTSMSTAYENGFSTGNFLGHTLGVVSLDGSYMDLTLIGYTAANRPAVVLAFNRNNLPDGVTGPPAAQLDVYAGPGGRLSYSEFETIFSVWSTTPQSVPEPGTFGLIGVGVGVLGVVRGRRARRAARSMGRGEGQVCQPNHGQA